jgi:HEAT repeat protein
MPLFGGPPDVAKLVAKKDVQGLIKALGYQKDPYGDMHRAAAKALGEIGDQRAVEPLIVALTDERVRITAIEALGAIGDPRAVESLIAALKDPAYYRREAAIKSLGQIGDPRAIEPLVAALGNNSPAIGVLVRLGDPRAVAPLIAALGSKDQNVRRAAAEVLGALRDARAVEPLITALNEIFMRKTAAKSLGAIGDSRAVEPLIAILQDHDGYAAEALGAIGDPRAVEPLLAALDDRSWEVRRDAAKALVIMYGTDRIDDVQRAAILSRRVTITGPRTQEYKHFDSGYKNKCADFDTHHDENRHTDEGFGVEFL